MNSTRLTNAIFDAVQSKRILKTGFSTLPGGIYASECDTVAAHSNAVAVLAVKLAYEYQEIIEQNFEKTISIKDIAMMALFHDYGETKSFDTGAQSKGIYPSENCKLHILERDGLQTILKGLKAEETIVELFDDYRKYDSLESVIVHIADNLEGVEKALHSSRGYNSHIIDMINRIIKENLSIYERKIELFGPVIPFLVNEILLKGIASLFEFYKVSENIKELNF